MSLLFIGKIRAAQIESENENKQNNVSWTDHKFHWFTSYTHAELCPPKSNMKSWDDILFTYTYAYLKSDLFWLVPAVAREKKMSIRLLVILFHLVTSSSSSEIKKPKRILFANKHCQDLKWGMREPGSQFFSGCKENNCVAEYDEEEYRKGKIIHTP